MAMSLEHKYHEEPLLFTAARAFEPGSAMVRLALKTQPTIQHLNDISRTMEQPGFNRFALANRVIDILERDVALHGLDPLSQLR